MNAIKKDSKKKIVTGISITLAIIVVMSGVYFFGIRKFILSFQLNEAIRVNDLIAAEKMLKKGADPNHRDMWFSIGDITTRYPIIYVCERFAGFGFGETMEDLSMVDLIVRYGGNVNFNKHAYGTPLTTILLDNNIEEKEITLAIYLIEKGADVNKIDKRGNSPLELVLNGYGVYDQNGQNKEAVERRDRLKQILIDAGAKE